MTLPQNIQEQITQQERRLLEEGERLGRFDQIRQRTFYSSYLFTPGVGGIIQPNEYKLFQAIEGDTGQGFPGALTQRETNWPARGRIADNHNLLVKAIGVAIQRGPTDPGLFSNDFVAATGIDPLTPPHPDEVGIMGRTTQLAMTFLTNSIPIGLLQDYPAPGGAYGWQQAGKPAPYIPSGVVPPVPGVEGILEAGDMRAFLPITRNATVPAFERRPKVPWLFQHGETFGMSLIVPRPIQFPPQNTNGGALKPANNDVAGMIEIVVMLHCTESFVEKS